MSLYIGQPLNPVKLRSPRSFPTSWQRAESETITLSGRRILMMEQREVGSWEWSREWLTQQQLAKLQAIYRGETPGPYYMWQPELLAINMLPSRDAIPRIKTQTFADAVGYGSDGEYATRWVPLLDQGDLRVSAVSSANTGSRTLHIEFSSDRDSVLSTVTVNAAGSALVEHSRPDVPVPAGAAWVRARGEAGADWSMLRITPVAANGPDSWCGAGGVPEIAVTALSHEALMLDRNTGEMRANAQVQILEVG